MKTDTLMPIAPSGFGEAPSAATPRWRITVKHCLQDAAVIALALIGLAILLAADLYVNAYGPIHP